MLCWSVFGDQGSTGRRPATTTGCLIPFRSSSPTLLENLSILLEHHTLLHNGARRTQQPGLKPFHDARNRGGEGVTTRRTPWEAIAIAIAIAKPKLASHCFLASLITTADGWMFDYYSSDKRMMSMAPVSLQARDVDRDHRRLSTGEVVTLVLIIDITNWGTLKL